MIVRQNEPAGAGLGGNFGRHRAHALRQDRRHEARAIGAHEFFLADGFARDERRTRDRVLEFVQRIGARGLANEERACGRKRPSLPAKVVLRNGAADADVLLRDENLDGFVRGLDDLLHRRRRAFAARQHVGGGTSRQSDAENDNTGGFHTLTLPLVLNRDPDMGRLFALCRISAAKGQLMVNEQ